MCEDRLIKIVKDYFNQVYKKAHKKVDKKVATHQNESMRLLNKKWRFQEGNNELFDIGLNMD